MTDTQQLADALFGGTTPTAPPAPTEQAGTPEVEPHGTAPASVQALRDADNSLYSSAPLAGLYGIDPIEGGRVIDDLGASGEDAQTLALLDSQARAADDETVQSWHAESVALLQSGTITDGDLALAQKFVARDPRVAEYLDRTSLGNHPAVVQRVVELARTANARGRLK